MSLADIPAGGTSGREGDTVAIRKRDHPDTWGGHGVEGHPPDESLRWDETPLAAVRLARLQVQIYIYYSLPETNVSQLSRVDSIKMKIKLIK